MQYTSKANDKAKIIAKKKNPSAGIGRQDNLKIY